MRSTNEIHKGSVIRHQGSLYLVTSCQFVNPGKGQAFTKTKLRDISTGKGTEVTYKSGESIEVVELQYQNMQYLYKNGAFYSFMNKDTYETVDVQADVVGDDAVYLKEGLDVVALVHDTRPVAIQLPKKIQYTIAQAPPAVRGDTSGNVSKEAIMDNGLRVNVPIFIKEGEDILVNPETGEYSGRAGE